MPEQSNTFQWPELTAPWKRLSVPFRTAFTAAFLSGLIAHLYMFSNLLLNHDSATQIYTANSVLSSGRWSLELLSVFSTYYQMPVVIGLISVLCLALTAGLTVQILGLTNRAHILLASVFLVTYPSIASIFSYLFTADAYFICLFLNAAAVYVAQRYRRGWLAAIPMLTLALGTYQAFICYAIGLFLFDCILMLLSGRPLDRVIARGTTYILSTVASLLLYYAVLHLLLAVTGTTLVDYQGLGGISLAQLGRFIAQIPQAYLLFFKHLLSPDYHSPFFQAVQCLFALFFAALACYLIPSRKLWKDPPRLLLFLAGLALIPMALNFVTVLAVDAWIHQLMVYSFVLFFLMTIKFSELVCQDLLTAGRKSWAPVFLSGCALSLVVGWGCFCATNSGYLSLQIRYENTFAAADRIVARIEALEGYSADTPVAIVGYLPEDLYGNTNPDLSKIDALTGTTDVILLSYYSAPYFLNQYIGLHLPPMTGEQWDSVYNSGLLDEMPCWPAAGSVVMHDGVAVVKLNDI